MRLRLGRSFVGLVVLSGTFAPAVSIAAVPTLPLPRVPYSAFQRLSGSAIDSVRMKLTYIGVSEMGDEPTLVIKVLPDTTDPGMFFPYQEGGYMAFEGDYRGMVEAQVTRREMKAILDSANTLDCVTGDVPDMPGPISLSLLRPNGDSTYSVFQSIMRKPCATALVEKMLTVISKNAAARGEVEAVACILGLRARRVLHDVSSRARVTLSQVRRRAGTNTHLGQLLVTNISDAPIRGPVDVLLQFDSDLGTLDPDGFTPCVSEYASRPYLRVSATGLGVGQSARARVTIDNPDNREINMRWVRVLSGGSGDH